MRQTLPPRLELVPQVVRHLARMDSSKALPANRTFQPADPKTATMYPNGCLQLPRHRTRTPSVKALQPLTRVRLRVVRTTFCSSAQTALLPTAIPTSASGFSSRTYRFPPVLVREASAGYIPPATSSLSPRLAAVGARPQSACTSGSPPRAPTPIIRTLPLPARWTSVWPLTFSRYLLI